MERPTTRPAPPKTIHMKIPEMAEAAAAVVVPGCEPRENYSCEPPPLDHAAGRRLNARQCAGAAVSGAPPTEMGPVGFFAGFFACFGTTCARTSGGVAAGSAVTGGGDCGAAALRNSSSRAVREAT